MVSAKRDDIEAHRQRLIIEIEAVEQAIEDAFFKVTAEALRSVVFRLQSELYRLEKEFDECAGL